VIDVPYDSSRNKQTLLMVNHVSHCRDLSLAGLDHYLDPDRILAKSLATLTNLLSLDLVSVLPSSVISPIARLPLLENLSIKIDDTDLEPASLFMASETLTKLCIGGRPNDTPERRDWRNMLEPVREITVSLSKRASFTIGKMLLTAL